MTHLPLSRVPSLARDKTKHNYRMTFSKKKKKKKKKRKRCFWHEKSSNWRSEYDSVFANSALCA
jgi:hypothetical protein